MQKHEIINLKTITAAEGFKILPCDVEAIKKEKLHYESARAASIEALKIIQKRYGWVEDQAIYEIAKILEIAPVEVEEVATFYNQIFRQPVGKNIIRYCDSQVCYIMGFEEIKKKLQKLLKIKPGCTTMNKKFTLLPTCCLGSCHRAPVIMINTKIYENVSSNSVDKILKKY